MSKKKGGKELSKQKKKRMERAMGKAEAVMEKLERKRGESVKRGKVVKDRRVCLSLLEGASLWGGVKFVAL